MMGKGETSAPVPDVEGGPSQQPALWPQAQMEELIQTLSQPQGLLPFQGGCLTGPPPFQEPTSPEDGPSHPGCTKEAAITLAQIPSQSPLISATLRALSSPPHPRNLANSPRRPKAPGICPAP